MARPRSDDYDEKRQNIIDESSKLFATVGFGTASISMIASKCGISKALIYHYYKDKTQILFDMLKNHVDELNHLISEALEKDLNPEEKLKFVTSLLMDIYMRTRDRHIVLMNEIHSLAPDEQEYLKKSQGEMIHGFSELIADLHGSKYLKSAGTKTAVGMMLLGSLNWTYTWFREGGAMSAEQYAEVLSEIFLSGIQSKKLAQLTRNGSKASGAKTK
ncbi:TetR/AcrR family transcriptional regulator [Oleomonas cavernae]|uniref:TetR/AcrR family transcriptional regulator n=1 Tax=Oleomonas cavernae TaxID=2320859 RepID=A0A418WIQ3_9PROT|nr:TetR/AcrR family transcriptional regulator [Oleomonas cavernae]RJF89832.1 TetR/AcrR family transcriptional regulator [Oleomonas cavernae]